MSNKIVGLFQRKGWVARCSMCKRYYKDQLEVEIVICDKLSDLKEMLGCENWTVYKGKIYCSSCVDEI